MVISGFTPFQWSQIWSAKSAPPLRPVRPYRGNLRRRHHRPRLGEQGSSCGHQGRFRSAWDGDLLRPQSSRSFPGKALDVLRSAFSPKYDGADLRRTITEIIGGDTLLGHIKHPCLIPTVSLTKGGPQIFKTDHHPDFQRDHRLRAVDVAMATSAAPSYFPIAEIGDGLYADGGLYANSPDLLARHEAEHFLRADPREIRLLSIGTTTAKFSFAHGSGLRFGMWQWAMGQRLVQAILSSQQQVVDSMIRHKLSERYVRLDYPQSREQEQSLGLDTANATAQRTIRAMADTTVQGVANDPMMREILSHNSGVPRFFHRSPAPQG